MSYYRQPEFFRDFRCMGGACPSTCCALWNISWKHEEIERLKQADCSPELRAIIDRSFTEYKENNNQDLMKVDLSNREGRKCPFLDEKGLCCIQKELGEEYLSKVCRQYPRIGTICDDVVLRTCSASCPAVLDILLKEPNAMRLVSAPISAGKFRMLAGKDEEAEKKKHPELKYRSQLLDFFFEIIGDPKRPLEVSLLLGALAAQKVTEFVNKGQADRIPEVMKALRPQLKRDSIPAFDKAVPDPQRNPGFIAELTDEFGHSDLLEPLMEGDILKLSRCAEGRRILNEYLSDKPHFMRNLALNFFLGGKMPFMNLEKSIFMNYCYFVVTVCSAKFLLAATAYKSRAVTYGGFALLSFYARGMYHNKADSIRVMERLEEKGCTSPAFLAVLLK